MFFPSLFIMLLLSVFLAFRYRQLNKKQSEDLDTFWDLERKARTTVKKDIDNLSYITIPMEKFPSDFTTEPDMAAFAEKAAVLSSEKILNLTGKSNTELKLSYGVNHFEEIAKAGENFDALTVLIMDTAKYLVSCERYTDAITLLEYGVLLKSDIGSNYTLLADCYAATGNFRRIEYLKPQIKDLHLLTEASVLDHLSELYAKQPPEDVPDDFTV